jgi:hypothetical protein
MTSSSAAFHNSENRADRKRMQRFLSYVKTPVMAASVIGMLDALTLVPLFGKVSKVTLVLILLFEGGLGLVAGTAIALSSTPSISKFGEITLGTARWSKEGEKNAERVAGKWVIASTLLILTGFALSAI